MTTLALTTKLAALRALMLEDLERRNRRIKDRDSQLAFCMEKQSKKN
jgi:hypothetical protein